MTWPTACPDPKSRHRFVVERKSERHVISFTWGDARVFGTPSYWISQYLIKFGQNKIRNLRIGANLFEETIACALGGYGVSAELGLAAFQLLKSMGLTSLSHQMSQRDIESALMKPIPIGGRYIKYRFPMQRAVRIMNIHGYFQKNTDPPEDPHSLREWLLGINGIGMKTASWIVRNYTTTDSVAIIDIHIQRACTNAGIFLETWKLPRDYPLMEEAFLNYAEAGHAHASVLDGLIWNQMRVLGGSYLFGNNLKNASFTTSNQGISIDQLFP